MAGVIAHGATAPGEDTASQARLAIGYESIGEPSRLHVAESTQLQPALTDIFRNSDYYYRPVHQSKLPHGIDPWSVNSPVVHRKSWLNGLFGNLFHSKPQRKKWKMPFALFGWWHSSGCGAASNGGPDCDCDHCRSQPSSERPQPRRYQEESRPSVEPRKRTEQEPRKRTEQRAPTNRLPQPVKVPTPLESGVDLDFYPQPIEPQVVQPNDVDDQPTVDLPINEIPEEFLPVDPDKVMPKRTGLPSESPTRVRKRQPIVDPPAVVPPVNTLPRRDVPGESALPLSPPQAETASTPRIRLIAPPSSLRVRSGTVREPRTAKLVVPAPRAAHAEGSTVKFRVYR
jgi:hypothetical protein